MPIENLSDIRRLPRLGKIKLGEKKQGQHGPYPSAVDYFICPPGVQAVYGDKPTVLDVMLPADDYELVAPQYYKCYSYSQGLICRGDGKHCKRKVDTETGDFANRDTQAWVLTEGVCTPDHCPMIGNKQCKRMMTLVLLLPEVPGLGIYHLNTSSFYSIVNINSQLAPDGYLRRFTHGRIAFLPLVLSIGPQEVNPVGQFDLGHPFLQIQLAGGQTVARLRMRGPLPNAFRSASQRRDRLQRELAPKPYCQEAQHDHAYRKQKDRNV